MRLVLSPEAAEQLSKLPKNIQKKAHKQFSFTLMDYHHPSLRARKMSGENKFEARVDRKYRFSFTVNGENLYILTLGTHDAGLGKN